MSIEEEANIPNQQGFFILKEHPTNRLNTAFKNTQYNFYWRLVRKQYFINFYTI
jgi:hypothetical protein